MAGLHDIKREIAGAAKTALQMWKSTHQAFMEHDLDLFSGILEKEHQLNELEKSLAADLVEAGRASKDEKERQEVLIYADIMGDIELIGDYCKDILERVQIKIEEKLLFSEEALKEYSELYRKTEEALDEVVRALDKDEPAMVGVILKHEEHIDNLVDKLRLSHNQRLVNGICSPFACNMFLNMLDFTAAVYYHTKKVARALLRIKR